jgi:small subunit ribosomal protein S3
LKARLYQAGISKMEIERAANKDKRAKMNIWTSRPGIVIGRKGTEV